MRLLVLMLLVFVSPICLGKDLTLWVDVTGLNEEEKQRVMSSLNIKSASIENKLTEDRIESLYQITPSEITNTLQALGYYHSKITSKLIPFPGGYLADYHVEKGPITRIQNITVTLHGEGRENNELASQFKTLPFKTASKYPSCKALLKSSNL